MNFGKTLTTTALLLLAERSNFSLNTSFSESRELLAVERKYEPIPGHNIHFVLENDGNFLIRGGAPTEQTLDALIEKATKDKKLIYFVDLRNPPRKYDLTPEGERLVPDKLKKGVIESGGRYVSLSSFRKDLPVIISDLIAKGDVYLGCHYGYNRTGFVCGRLQQAGFNITNTEGLGKKDFQDGITFQRKYGKPILEADKFIQD